MITVQAPWALWVSGAAALGVVLAHLLSVGRPPELALPTTRFVPVGPLEAVSRARALRDLLLLLLRVLVVILAGAAFAGVRVTPPRAPVASLVVLDLPQQASDTAGWRTAARAALADVRRPVLGLVTSDGRTMAGEPLAQRTFVDTVSLARWEASASSLAGALLAARREAAVQAAHADSLALVVISPLRADVTAAALPAARATWPGRVDLVPVAWTNVATDVAADVAADAATDSWTDTMPMPVRTRRRYGAPSGDDSAFARRGGTLIVWPDSARRAPTDGALADSTFAVVTHGVALVAPLHRARRVPEGAQPRAWYADGSVAVGETVLGAGCVRWVGFAEPAGDALLTGSSRPLRAVLEGGCEPITWPRLADSMRAALAGSGSLAPSTRLTAGENEASAPVAPWALLAALCLLLIEQLVRTRAQRVGAP
jgi:hypothetical protein